MRLIDRRDTPLVAALLVGTIVMFTQPLRSVLSLAEEISKTYHVDLVPGLFIFVAVFSACHWQRYRESSLALRQAAREAEEARRNAERMEQLVATSNALVNAVDFPSFRREAYLHIPQLFGHRPIWIGLVESGKWRWVIEPADGSGDDIADVGPGLIHVAESGECHHNEWKLFVLRGAGRSLGLLGVSNAETLAPLDLGRVEAVLAVISGSVKNVQLFEELQVSCVTDSLTGCFNRAYAVTTLDAELRRRVRTKSELAAVMLDVDRFKAINDQYGHVSGDKMLMAIGEALRRTLRTSDVKCRYGGDEFFIILPETPREAAEHVAEHLRTAIEQIDLQDVTPRLSCRVSLGVAFAEPGELNSLAVIQRADEAMYRDKAHHRIPPFEQPVVVVRAASDSTSDSAPAAALPSCASA
jgi:diguanylate cyclase (GGDEF)-like protein